jgi:hypothetical protein
MNVQFIISTIHHFLFFSKNANFKNYTILKFLIFLIQLIGLTQNVTMPFIALNQYFISCKNAIIQFDLKLVNYFIKTSRVSCVLKYI